MYCTLYNIQYSTVYCTLIQYSIRSLRTRTTIKILISKLESWWLVESIPCQIGHYKLNVDVKTPFHLLYNSLIIQNLGKFRKLALGKGKRDSWREHCNLTHPPGDALDGEGKQQNVPRWLRPCTFYQARTVYRYREALPPPKVLGKEGGHGEGTVTEIPANVNLHLKLLISLMKIRQWK